MLISAAEQLLEDGQILTLLLSGQISFFFLYPYFNPAKSSTSVSLKSRSMAASIGQSLLVSVRTHIHAVA